MQGNVVNEIELNNHIEKLACLIKIQEETFNNIKNTLNKLSSHYTTNNTNKILELNKIEEENYNTLKESLDKYRNIISYTASKYHNLAKNVEKTFDNII